MKTTTTKKAGKEGRSSVVLRRSYSDGMEAVPFHSAETAKKWMEKDKEYVRAMLRDQGYTPADTENGISCTEQMDSIYYDWQLDADKLYYDDPAEADKNAGMVSVVAERGLFGNIAAYAFHDQGHAREWADACAANAAAALHQLGYNPVMTGRHVADSDDPEIHADVWLFEPQEFMDKEPKEPDAID